MYWILKKGGSCESVREKREVSKMLEAMAEAMYVGLFVAGMAVLNQHLNINQAQARRRTERKKELMYHEWDIQCRNVN